MFERYRPSLGNGEKVHEVEATPMPEPQASQAREQAVITHKTGDEKSQAFWKMLVSSNPESLVAKETAVFAIRAISAQMLGFKAHRMSIDFGGDLVTVEELFATLEKLSGGYAGWQLAQRLAGY